MHQQPSSFFKLSNDSECNSNGAGLSCVTWNVHSLVNKCRKVMEHILDYKADIVFLSETWLTSQNNNITATIKEYGYVTYHKVRKHDIKTRGGGVGLLCSNKLDVKVKNLKLPKFNSFEYCVYSLKAKNRFGKPCSVILIPLYRDQYVNIDIFIDEFGQLLQKVILTNSYLVISGDFNIKWGSADREDEKFNDLLKLYNMCQHVTTPTNAFNNIIDMVITSNYEIGRTSCNPSVYNLSVSNVHLSDHFLVSFKINLEGTLKKNKVVNYRHFKSIDPVAFRDDLSVLISSNIENSALSSFGVRSTLFHSSLTELLDLHAPLKTKIVKNVPRSSWFNHDYVLLRRKRRRAEKHARKTGLTIHKEIYINLRNETTKLAASLKHSNIVSKLELAKGDQKALYSTFHNLTDQTNDVVLPDHTSEKVLADEFSNFFVRKVQGIRDSFHTKSSFNFEYNMFNGTPLSVFKLATVEDVKAIIMEHGIKCSSADILPQQVLYEYLDLFLPIWTDLVNASLKEGSMEGLKSAYLRPIYKATGLDPNLHNSYRPVSNLPFLSKLIERVVSKQLQAHMEENGLNIDNQSGYKKGHSTETLLIKITNDLLIASDKDTASVLLLLDLSAAFDTVDVDKLLDILFMEIGIRGLALKWFKSFLKCRKQRVKIGNSLSDEIVIEFGVPQGSVLGPILFNIYIRSFYRFVGINSDFKIQGFADDHQMYTSFSLNNQVYMLGENIINMLSKVKLWMDSFFLCLNEKKTKIIVFAPQRLRKLLIINGIFIGEKCIRFPNVAKNLGVLLDGTLSFKEQISHCVKSCYMNIRQISSIKSFLNTDQRKVLVTALVLSQLDYCNGVLYNVNTNYIKQLQAVQNCAVKLIFDKRKYDTGLTNLFSSLHWLRVNERIIFKILLLVHKCLYHCSPTYLNEMLQLTYGFVRTGDLVSVKTKYASSDGAFSVCAPKLWNSLPMDIKCESSTIHFKRKLKTFLFENSHN